MDVDGSDQELHESMILWSQVSGDVSSDDGDEEGDNDDTLRKEVWTPKVGREPGELTAPQKDELADLVAGGGLVDPSLIDKIWAERM